LYLYNPSLNPAPPTIDPGNTTYVYVITSFQTLTAFETLLNVSWTVSKNASDANGPSPHKCLIARCYPKDSPPDPNNIDYAPPGGDPHYAQHNVTVDAVPSGKMHRIGIRTGNFLAEPQLVAIQAVPDLNPARQVLDTFMPTFKATKGFKQVSNKPLRNVSLSLEPLTHKPGGCIIEKIEDIVEDAARDILRVLEGKHAHAAPGGSGAIGKVRIGPKFYTEFDFIVDTTGAQPGDAFIYQLTETTSAGLLDGGLGVGIVVT
jgi:hypothetical protein